MFPSSTSAPLSTSILVTLAALATPLLVAGQGTTGQPVFVGCVDDSYSPTNAYDKGAFNSATACATACYNDPGHFQYSTWTIVPQDINRCYCSNDGPPSNLIQDAMDTMGTCNTQTQSYVHITASTFSLVGCKSTEAASGNVIVNLPDTCLGSCIGFPYAVMKPASDGLYECACGSYDGDIGPQAVTCGPNAWSSYQHGTGAYVAGPTGFVKRAEREKKRLQEVERELHQFCPAGLTACKVPGDDLAYECISVDDELESCGGCLNGYFDSAITEIAGTDCTTLFGVSPGAVTCAQGLCQAFACEDGYELASNATCVAV
ncbi:hypothetical protein IAU60_006751 [Kwoniella sp. DSM 27419]